MEIYNEMLRDLLSVEPEAKLDIKQNKDGTMYVPKLTHVKVSGVSDVNQVCFFFQTSFQTPRLLVVDVCCIL